MHIETASEKIKEGFKNVRQLLPFAGIYTGKSSCAWLGFVLELDEQESRGTLAYTFGDSPHEILLLMGDYKFPVYFLWEAEDLEYISEDLSKEVLEQLSTEHGLYFLYGGSGNNEVTVEKITWGSEKH